MDAIDNIKELAIKAYDAYTAAVGGVNFKGEPLPTGEEFFADPSKEKQAAGWMAAVEATREGGTFGAALQAMKCGKGARRPDIGTIYLSHKVFGCQPRFYQEDGLRHIQCEVQLSVYDMLQEDWEIVD